VPGNKKIEVPVVIIVPEGCPGTPHEISPCNVCLSRDVREGTVTVVPVKDVRPVVVNKKVDEAIVVIVCGDSSESPAISLYTSSARDIGEGPITIIPKEIIVRRILAPGRT
jgi:hypothetical protein